MNLNWDRRGYAGGMIFPLVLVIGLISAVFVPAYHDIGAGGKRMIKILFLVAQCAAIVGVTGFLFWRSKKSRSR